MKNTSLTIPETNSSSPKIGPNCPKEKPDRILTIHFQGEAASFRESVPYFMATRRENPAKPVKLLVGYIRQIPRSTQRSV